MATMTGVQRPIPYALFSHICPHKSQNVKRSTQRERLCGESHCAQRISALAHHRNRSQASAMTFSIDWSDFARLFNEVSPDVCDELVLFDAPSKVCSIKAAAEFHDQVDKGGQVPNLLEESEVSDDDEEQGSHESCLRRQSVQASKCCRKKRIKQVSFSTLEVREYDIIVGDHPWCRDGLALSLDWTYNATPTVYDFIPYEESREEEPRRQPRKLSFAKRLRRLQHVLAIEEMQDYVEGYREYWEKKKAL